MNNRILYSIVCIMHLTVGTVLGIFDPVPGDMLWNMVDQIGTINQTIAGCVMPIRAADITATGYVISQPGNYAFIQDVTYVPGGTNAAITITVDNVSLDLNHFTLATADTTVALINVDSNVSNVIIRNARLRGGGNSIVLQGLNSFVALTNILATNASQDGIAVTTASNLLCNNIRAYNHGNNGLSLNGSNSNIAVLDSSFSYNTSNGISGIVTGFYSAESAASHNGISGFDFNSSTGISIIISHATLNGGYGIGIQNSSNILLDGIKTYSNTSAGLYCSSSSNISINNVVSTLDNVGKAVNDNTDLNLYNIVITEPTGIGIHDTTETAAINSTYANIGIYNAGSHGIQFAGPCTQLIIDNAQITNPTGYGIAFFNTSDNIIITNTDIIAPTNNGIHFEAETTVTNISIQDTYTSRSTTGGGIVVNAFAQNVTIDDTQSINNALDGITFSATTTSVLVHNSSVLDNSNNGITFDVARVFIDFDDINIDKCFVISNTHNGILLTGSVNSSITNNTVIHNASTLGVGNGITVGSSVIASFFTYIGFNDLVFNNDDTFSHFNIQNWGSALFSGIKQNGIAGNFAFCANTACNYDSTPAQNPSNYHDVHVNVAAGGGWDTSPASSHWQAINCYM